MTYKRMYNMSQKQFCDEMFRGYQHLVNFDFNHARKETRQYACTFDTELEGGKWLRPKNYPEEYGFNAIKLDDKVNLNARKFRLNLQGDNLRYGFVGITTDGQSVYSNVNATEFVVPKSKRLSHLYLIVMGAPLQHHQIPMPTDENYKNPQNLLVFPYSFRIFATR
jgi:hypothetical protein